MKKSIIIILFLLSSFAYSQNRVLSGVVIDSLTRVPLEGAIVSLGFGDQNLYTDKKGEFNFLLLPESVIVSVRHLGYQPFRTTIDLPSENIVIELNNLANAIEEVIITAQGSESVKRPILGVNSLNIKTLEKLPSALGEVDILRGLQVLPGVSSVGEASNGVNIRGGTTDQNLFLIDDIPIYNPTHMFGLFSAFPSESVSGFDLYKGNVPIRYAGRTAAILDVKLANPNLNQFKIEGGLSIVSSKFYSEIPIVKEKLAVSLAARASYSDFLFKYVSPQLKDIKANFLDGSAKFFLKINNKNTLTASFYGSNDFTQTNLLGSIENIDSKNTQFQYHTIGSSLKWFYGINKKMNLQTSIVQSYYSPQTILPETLSSNKVSIGQSILSNQIKTNLNLYFKNHTLELIADGIFNKINPGVLDPGQNENVVRIETPIERGMEFGLGVEDQIAINEKINVSIGLRYSNFLNLGPNTKNVYQEGVSRDPINLIDQIKITKGQISQFYGGFEPRIGFNYQVSRLSNIKFAYNIARQYLQLVSNTTTPIPTARWKLSDNNIMPQISQLVSLGYLRNTKRSVFEYGIETYLRQTKNVLDYKPGADFLLNQTPETEILQGINNSYGLEFMVSKKKGEVKGQANYTYARSLNKINTGPLPSQQINQGDWYAANYDRPHTFNANLIINGGVHHDISLNFTYSTGRPISIPVGFINYANQKLPYYEQRNTGRLQDYHRLDFAWNIYNPKIRTKNFKGNFAFSIYNIYARKNAYSVFFKNIDGVYSAQKLIIFGTAIPSISYNFKIN